MNIDKQNGLVCFSEQSHTYWNVNDNGKYISVTTLIEKFAQPFDEDFWSAYKALERLIPADSWKIEKKSLLNSHKVDTEILTLYNIKEQDFNKAQQDILDEWDKTNKESCERGTKIHAQLEESMYKMGANVSLKKFGVGGKFVCDKGRTELDLENGVYPEYLISRESPDGVLRIAGQIDLLVKQGNDITIIDYKTNKEIKQHSFFDSKSRKTIRMKYPLGNLEDCNYYHYTLQLSTYAWMLQKFNPNFKIKDLIMVHFDHSGNQTVYHLDYLKDEVEKMLRFYKRDLLHKKQLSKYQRIEY
jgi:hypothetical protein